MPRFVVLRHETPPGYPRPPHYDLMLEQGGGLWTWALQSLPVAGGEAVAAERLPDHRPDYLDYEGEVTRDRGYVTRVDRGSCEAVAARGDELRFRVAGASLDGQLELKPAEGSGWEIRLHASAPGR
jgi:hypothetical protein